MVSSASLVPDEDELVVVVPAVLLRVHARLGLRRRSGGARSTAAGHAVSVIVQIVEGLLNKAVLQEEARGVAVRAAVVGSRDSFSVSPKTSRHWATRPQTRMRDSLRNLTSARPSLPNWKLPR